jgi:uncharacterized protein YceH (UPF0502 family)
MINLSLNEIRVLGVLFEKERTTPDQYPLSLNALTNACNQKSNREPVLSLSESEVQATVDSLMSKSLVADVVAGSRVKKYRQRFGTTQFSEFKLSLQEQSVISVLFLRGSQTPGELRTRTNRLCEFRDVEEVEQLLQGLIDRSGDTYVKKLPREPGKRESRYVHLFSGDPVTISINTATDNIDLENTAIDKTGYESCETKTIAAVNVNNEKSDDRVSLLEQQVTIMQKDIDELRRLWAELNE